MTCAVIPASPLVWFRPWLRPLVLGLLLAVAPPVAEARKAPRPGAKADPAVAEAKRHFQEGETHYKLGRFEPALAAFTRAYEAKPLPAFLFNLGQCQRQLKNWERALFFYQGYLREVPDSPNRAVVEGLISEVTEAQQAAIEQARLAQESQRAAASQAQQDAAAQTEAARLAEERRRLEEQRLALEQQQTDQLSAALAAPIVVQAPPPPPDPFYATWWFWAIVGSTVALAAGGTALALNTGGELITVMPEGSLGYLDRR